MVRLCLILRRKKAANHREEVNCVPLSLVMIVGTPKRENHPWNMAEAHSVARYPP